MREEWQGGTRTDLEMGDLVSVAGWKLKGPLPSCCDVPVPGVMETPELGVLALECVL